MVDHDLVLKPGDSVNIRVVEADDRSTTAPGSTNNNYNEFKIAGGSRRGKKTRKIGGAKRKMSGFMKFSQKVRPEVMRENPGIAFGEVGKRLGARWRALSDSEKAKY
jgi:structure-specific recognition protein 1